MKVGWMIEASKSYGIKLSLLCGQKRVSVHTKVVGLRILIDYFLYPTNNSNRTQRRSPIVPSEWVGGYPTGRVRRYPAAGYRTTQPLGIKHMKKDIKMMLL